uniref:Cytochrome P450 n=1 Tax=Panagrolaimus sp. ES5 TaxID=591445 RepID=A0AC34FJG5_9BILA
MEKEFRVYTESPSSPGLMRLWLGPKPIILVYKPETIKVILESPTLITKPMEYNALRQWVGVGLLTSTGEAWHTRRKMLTPESAMGINLGAQKGFSQEYCEAVRRMSEMIFMRIRAPWLWPKSLWYLSGYGSEFDENLKIAQSVTKRVIIERKQERERIRNDDSSSESSKESIKEIWEEENLGIKAKHKRSAFLDLLLDMQEENKLTDTMILNEVDTFMFEGHDTVSSSMGYTVYMISQKPEIQEKIYEELKGIMETSDAEITHEDVGRMKYLEQCIKETMRMFPTVPLIARVIEEDTVVGDFILPKGVTALVAPFAVHRDRRFFDNPDNFDPEHFSSENYPFNFILGQKFATMEQKLILGRFFRRYKVTAALHELENRGLPELILKPAKGFPVRIERRPE